MKVNQCNLIRPLSCESGMSVAHAARILKDNKQRRLIVVKNGVPIGIVSTTDMNNKIVAEDKDPKGMKIDDIMASPIFLTCDFEDELAPIFKKMHQHETFFVPVTKEGRLHGVLTYGELLERATEVIKNG